MPIPGKEGRDYRTWCKLPQAFANTNCQNPFHANTVGFKSVKLQGPLRKRPKHVTTKTYPNPNKETSNQTTKFLKNFKSTQKIKQNRTLSEVHFIKL